MTDRKRFQRLESDLEDELIGPLERSLVNHRQKPKLPDDVLALISQGIFALLPALVYVLVPSFIPT